MPFVDPGAFTPLQVVNETNMNNIRDDLNYLNANLNPIGGLLPYAGTSAPTGWLLCDGSAVSRTTYAGLFAIISTNYGPGNGSTTFNVPDLQQKFPMGKAAAGTGSTLGGTGGSKDAIAVSHNHTQDTHGHTINAHSHTGTDDAAGGHDHNQTAAGSNPLAVKTGSALGLASPGDGQATYDTGKVGRTTSDGSHQHTFTTNGGGNNSNNTTATNQSAGSSGTDANLPAYQVFLYIIKY